MDENFHRAGVGGSFGGSFAAFGTLGGSFRQKGGSLWEFRWEFSTQPDCRSSSDRYAGNP